MEIPEIKEPSWNKALSAYTTSRAFKDLLVIMEKEYKERKVFPPQNYLFKAFELTAFKDVRVVILGQDPYHDDGQAEGLSFSVPQNTKLPPSLKNIYKEIETDLGTQKDFSNGSLESWTKQGVFLLNSILTVVAHTPASHKKKGWEEFTDIVIKTLSEKREHVVFILWGNYARSKKHLIDEGKHLILEGVHPSPLSAYQGFFGCKHFSKTNAYLKKHHNKEISW